MYRVALVVITRDEAPRIGRLLASVAPWVDEMVVMDTGSTDDTIRLAHVAGARVGQFAWVDDFSAARNAALDFTRADWHLMLDADNWLVEGGSFLRELKFMRPDFVGTVRIEEHLGEDGSARSVDHPTRLLPGWVRYEGRIHEQPAHNLPARRTPLRVEHDGYLPQALAAKRGRNRQLLLESLASTQGDPYLLYQLGKDASVYDEHALAEEAFSKGRQQMRGDEPWLIDMVVRRLHALTQLGEFESALQVARAEADDCDASPDFHFACGSLFLQWTASEPERAPALLQAAEASWRHCLELGERPEIPGAVLGRGGALAGFNLALVCEGTGRMDEATALRKRFGLGSAPHLAQLSSEGLPDQCETLQPHRFAPPDPLADFRLAPPASDRSLTPVPSMV